MGSTYTFANATTNYASAATQAKFDSITTAYLKLRFRGDFILNVPNGAIRYWFELPGRYNYKLGIYRDGNNIEIVRGDTNEGYSFTGIIIDRSTLVAANEYHLYLGIGPAGAGNFVAQLFDDAGTSLGSISAVGIPFGNAGAGNGAIRLGNDGAAAHEWTLDGIAIYSAALSGGDRWSVPAAGDSNIIGLYKFDEGTGTTVDDATGGTDLTISGSGTWNTADGAWDGVSGAVRRPYY